MENVFFINFICQCGWNVNLPGNLNWAFEVWIAHQAAAGKPPGCRGCQSNQLPSSGAWALWQPASGQLPGRSFTISIGAWKENQSNTQLASRKTPIQFPWNWIHSCSPSFLPLSHWTKSFTFWPNSWGKSFYVSYFRQYINPIKWASWAFYLNRSILHIGDLQHKMARF